DRGMGRQAVLRRRANRMPAAVPSSPSPRSPIAGSGLAVAGSFSFVVVVGVVVGSVEADGLVASGGLDASGFAFSGAGVGGEGLDASGFAFSGAGVGVEGLDASVVADVADGAAEASSMATLPA